MASITILPWSGSQPSCYAVWQRLGETWPNSCRDSYDSIPPYSTETSQWLRSWLMDQEYAPCLSKFLSLAAGCLAVAMKPGLVSSFFTGMKWAQKASGDKLPNSSLSWKFNHLHHLPRIVVTKNQEQSGLKQQQWFIPPAFFKGEIWNPGVGRLVPSGDSRGKKKSLFLAFLLALSCCQLSWVSLGMQIPSFRPLSPSSCGILPCASFFFTFKSTPLAKVHLFLFCFL